jgi:hypothetical protein
MVHQQAVLALQVSLVGWPQNFSQVMEHFIKHSHSSKRSPSLLICDNHKSLKSIKVLDMAKKQELQC